jgi:hypothetical protein
MYLYRSGSTLESLAWNPLGQPENPAPPGEQFLDTSRLKSNPLSGHGGGGDNLALRWNAVSRDAQEIDVVVHLHGYINLPPDVDTNIARPPTSNTLRDLVARSGLDLSGRARPTLAVVPRGRRITADEVQREQERLNELARTGRKTCKGKPCKARSDRFTFPALLRGDGAGLESLLAYAVDWFARNKLGRSDGRSLQIGRLIFTAHSGGGAAVNVLLKQHARRRACNPDEVQAFDAFYAVDGVKSWVTARLALDRAMIAVTLGLLGRDMIDSLGGGLRVIYSDETRAGSCGVDGVLPGPGDKLRPWYRAELTTVRHNDIPLTFGGKLLRDRAADLGLRSECGVRPKVPSATPSKRKS